MDVFDNLKQKVTDTAKYAAKKSNDILEITKININISSEEEKIRKAYSDIGKTVYKNFLSGDVAEQYKSDCEKIKLYESNIDEMKKKKRELRSIKLCPGCNSELDLEMTFCFRCGSKQEVVVNEKNDDNNNDGENEENNDGNNDQNNG